MSDKKKKMLNHINQACSTRPEFLSVLNGETKLLDELVSYLHKHIREYKYQNKREVLTQVKKCVNDTQASANCDSGNNGLGMNQTMRAIAHRSNGGAKRPRPADNDAREGSGGGDGQENGEVGTAKGTDPNGGEGALVSIPDTPTQTQGPTSRKNYPKHKKVSGVREGGDQGQSQSNIPEGHNNDNSSSFSSFRVSTPSERLNDLAGLDKIIDQVRELIFLPVQHPQLYSALGVRPPCGVLLLGPSGCGKTHLANAIAGELNLPYFRAGGPELIGGISGESEKRVCEIFKEAMQAAPSVLFIDGLDVIAAKVEVTQQRGMERRVIAQLLNCIDELNSAKSPSAATATDIDIDTTDTALATGTETDLIKANKDMEIVRVGDLASTSASAAASCKVTTPFAQVILICASSKPESLDPGVRGRLSRELSLPVPDARARTDILKIMSSAMKTRSIICDESQGQVQQEDHKQAIDLISLGKMTPGFVGADLRSMAREAGMIAVARVVRDKGLLDEVVNGNNKERSSSSMEVTTVQVNSTKTQALTEAVAVEGNKVDIDMSNVFVEMCDFVAASKSVQPSAKREGFAVVPDVTWEDVGALTDIREELVHNVLEPIAHPERFRSLGLEVPAGVLFFGPPGCGKTLLAKAVANQSGANFISVKGPELLNMFVGESESRVRQVFSRARASSPCVIFFDELDALCPKRGTSDSGNGVSERVVNQLLTEMDGLETRKDVYIIAATNRLELIDDAMLRPGRLGKLLYVPLPSAVDRESILHSLTRSLSLKVDEDENEEEGVVTSIITRESDQQQNSSSSSSSSTQIDHRVVDLKSIAIDSRTNGFSGADLAALVREAGLAVMQEWREKAVRTAQAAAVDAGKAYSPSSIVWPVGTPRIAARHFEVALSRVRPSVSEEDRQRYERVHLRLRDGIGAIQALQMG